MDPDTALDQMRELCRGQDSDLATLVQWLDDWLSTGGRLPQDWDVVGDERDE